jgi:hypothetical protein
MGSFVPKLIINVGRSSDKSFLNCYQFAEKLWQDDLEATM